MDNCSIYGSIAELAMPFSISVKFLLLYLLEFNAVELLFSKLKTWVQCHMYQYQDDPEVYNNFGKFLQEGMDLIDQHIKGFFEHAGYH